MTEREIVANSRPLNDDNDDDVPYLSADTFKALQEFYAEKEAIEKGIDENWVRYQKNCRLVQKTKKNADFLKQKQLSQFWYDKATSERLAKEALTNAVNALKAGASSYNIGCISCPTLFKSLYAYVRELKTHPDLAEFPSFCDKIDIKLFEYDKRFECYGADFLFYDYKNSLAIDAAYHNYFDFIISDPPYLSDECHVKTGMTIKKIGKSDHKLLICTG